MHQTRAQTLIRQTQEVSLEISPAELAAVRAQKADKATYNRVVKILNKRPIRLEGGFWKVVWRFIVAEKEPGEIIETPQITGGDKEIFLTQNR